MSALYLVMSEFHFYSSLEFITCLQTSGGRNKNITKLLGCSHRRLAVEITGSSPVRRGLVERRGFLATDRHHVWAPIRELAPYPPCLVIARWVRRLLLGPPGMLGIGLWDRPNEQARVGMFRRFDNMFDIA